MFSITFTADQAAAIAAKWNQYANEANQITADQAHLVPEDSFEADIEDTGEHMVEVGAFKSATGRPITFTISANDVTIEEVAE